MDQPVYTEVSVEKELPPKNGYYNVVCCLPTELGVIHWHKDTGWQNGFYNDRVTHWLKPVELSSLIEEQESKDNWISVEDKLPERNLTQKYSQVQCLCWYKNGVCILTFNHQENCWDGEDGDDHECDLMDVPFWKPLPSPPKTK